MTEAFNIDCMEAMAKMKDNEFDLAIVDPPYATGRGNGNFGRGGRKSAQPKTYRKDLGNYTNFNTPPSKEYFAELFRVSKNQIIWGANYYPESLFHSGWIVWDKRKKDGVMSEGELAFQSYDKRISFFRFEWEGFRKGPGSFADWEKSIVHPNQKPLALYKWLLKNYAKEGDRILDTHLGSGSSRIAAYDMGFDFVGYEIDKDYFDAQEKRFNNHIKQQSLFNPKDMY